MLWLQEWGHVFFVHTGFAFVVTHVFAFDWHLLTPTDTSTLLKWRKLQNIIMAQLVTKKVHFVSLHLMSNTSTGTGIGCHSLLLLTVHIFYFSIRLKVCLKATHDSMWLLPKRCWSASHISVIMLWVFMTSVGKNVSSEISQSAERHKTQTCMLKRICTCFKCTSIS